MENAQHTKNCIAVFWTLGTLTQQQQEDFFNELMVAVGPVQEKYAAMSTDAEDVDISAHIADEHMNPIY